METISSTFAEFWVVPIAAALALVFAWVFFKIMMKNSEGTDRMKEIAQYVREGAMAYLSRQYKVVGIVFAVLFSRRSAAFSG
jgi:K(+)-stimulated pyrophosphate-energized sodium pump